MRIHQDADGVSVHAISGSYVVMLAMDATDEAKSGLLGFAIQRTDRTENETDWLKGMRTFESVYPNPPEGSLTSTHDHPIQDFLWSDFTAKPEHDYLYRVVPVRGQPSALEYGTPVEVRIRTEREVTEVHSVWFNRGVIGSQAYARKFHNQNPHQLRGEERDKAYKWLSRGLFEAMCNFVRQAKDETFGLRAAVYEFSYEPIIAEFKKAQELCGNVKIVYDARVRQAKGKPDPSAAQRVKLTRNMLRKYKLLSKDIAIPRKATPNTIAHNKFIVLLKASRPVAVWTGSTNFTESGIFGQSNVGHVVRDPTVAAAFLEYWERLIKDPAVPALRAQNNRADPDLKKFPPPPGITPIFSPRQKNAAKKSMLDWYANAMSKSRELMCFTAAFGINKVFTAVLGTKSKADDSLRYLFLEKWGVRKDLAAKTRDAIQRNFHNVAAVGGVIKGDVLHGWLQELLNPLSSNVHFTHTKYMLIDPLGEDPVVVSGSANFSDASTFNNDENMLIIRGDKRSADIYLGEFMRLWQHYLFRTIVNADASDHLESEPPGYLPNYLCEDDAWVAGFYKPGTLKCLQRLTFRGLRGQVRAAAAR